MENRTTTTFGNLTAVLLTIVFFIAKVTGYIDWPWIWVLSPLWLGFALVIVLFIIYVMVAVILGVWANM